MRGRARVDSASHCLARAAAVVPDVVRRRARAARTTARRLRHLAASPRASTDRRGTRGQSVDERAAQRVVGQRGARIARRHPTTRGHGGEPRRRPRCAVELARRTPRARSAAQLRPRMRQQRVDVAPHRSHTDPRSSRESRAGASRAPLCTDERRSAVRVGVVDAVHRDPQSRAAEHVGDATPRERTGERAGRRGRTRRSASVALLELVEHGVGVGAERAADEPHLARRAREPGDRALHHDAVDLDEHVARDARADRRAGRASSTRARSRPRPRRTRRAPRRRARADPLGDDRRRAPRGARRGARTSRSAGRRRDRAASSTRCATDSADVEIATHLPSAHW